MHETNPEVDAFMDGARRWRDEFAKLRAIALDCGLTEELKWRLPCYTSRDKNIVILQGFKEYCALMFFKGALLDDPEGILVAPGRTQAGRQIRFTDVREIGEMEATLTSYIHEAVDAEKSGKKVELKKTSEFTVPEEFQKELDENPTLKAAFDALTPGRQRAYLFHFSGAKQSKTRTSRVEKHRQRILDGKGLNDR
jgi:uncharacterized protein YdeI (YjbR/CyaY-like superfamily)